MKRILITICLFALAAANLLAQAKVTFNITNLPAKPAWPKPLYFAGSFNGWKQAENDWAININEAGKYTATFNIPPGNYEYKITRGSWRTVECRTAGAAFENRSVRIVHDTTINIQIAEWRDNYPVLINKHTASKQVHIINEQFEIPQLGRKRRIWIYLPADYETSHKKYPVIYMHDGQNLFDEFTGNGEWGVDEFLDQLKPRDKQVIVVGIDHGGEYRLTEYDPYDSKYGKGTGDAYVQFLTETLKPYIDQNYRTKKDAVNTTIAGSSMGGLISLYAVLKHPDVFGNAGIFSPAFWIAPQIYDYAKANALTTSRFYFVVGDSEGSTQTEDMLKMVAILKAKGIPDKNIPSVIIKGGKHEEKQWRGDYPDFYRWLMMGK